MTDSLRAHRALLVILGVGLALRIALLLASASMPLQIVDEQHYTQIASNLLHGYGFGFAPGALTSMRPPLYPAFVAAIWTVSGAESLQAVRAVQIFLSLLTVTLIYTLAMRLFDRRTAVVAAAVVCFYPSFLFSGLLLLTEVLFTLLVVLFVLQYAWLVAAPSNRLSLAMGVTLALGALTRSVLYLFPVVALPLLLLTVRAPFRRRIAFGAVFMLGFALTLAPWAVRNSRLQHTLTIVDTMGGMNLRMGNYEHTPEDRMWDAVSLTGEKSWTYGLGETHPEAIGWTDGQKEKWAQREGLAYMRAHPGTTLRRSVLKFADFWGLERDMIASLQQGLYHPPAWMAVVAIVAVLIAYPLIALGAAIGIFRAVPSDRRVPMLMLLLAAFMTGIHAIVFGHSRYHLPLVPFMAMYAAALLVRGDWRPAPQHSWLATAGAAVACMVLLAAWSHEVLFRDVERVRALLHYFA